MLINLSNHPQVSWGKKQITTAKKLYGNIIDIQFPKIDSNGNEEYIDILSEKYLKLLLESIECKLILLRVKLFRYNRLQWVKIS